MSFYRGMTCENVTIKGDKGSPITAYAVKPSGPGPFGVVLVHRLGIRGIPSRCDVEWPKFLL